MLPTKDLSLLTLITINMKLERVFYMTAITLLSVLLLWNWKCQKGCPVITTTETTKDSIVYRYLKDTAATIKPSPVAIHKHEKLVTPSGEPLYLISADSARIIDDYFDTKQYQNTYTFDFGTVVVDNSISENAIQFQQVIPNFTIPEKTTTITKTVTATETKEVEVKRTQLYFGADIIGNKQYPFNGVDASLALKTKKDMMYEIGALKLNNMPLNYRVGIKVKIHF